MNLTPAQLDVLRRLKRRGTVPVAICDLCPDQRRVTKGVVAQIVAELETLQLVTREAGCVVITRAGWLATY